VNSFVDIGVFGCPRFWAGYKFTSNRSVVRRNSKVSERTRPYENLFVHFLFVPPSVFLRASLCLCGEYLRKLTDDVVRCDDGY
jgi:hypothetical protein